MGSRRHGTTEVVFDDRRERDRERERDRDRDYPTSQAGSRYEDDHYYEQEIEFRRSAPPVRERDRDRDREEIEIREERIKTREPPAFLRDDYGRTSAGPVVLRSRQTEDFDFAPRQRRRSRSLESERRVERESIVIRRDNDDTDSRYAPRRDRSREREEIVIRRDTEEAEPRYAPRRDRSREREEIVIRRDTAEAEPRHAPRRERSREREEIIIRRGEKDKSRSIPAPAPLPPPPPPLPEEVQREEIIIRREERSRSRPPPRDDRESETITISRRRDEEDREPRYKAPPPPSRFEREDHRARQTRDDDARSYTAKEYDRDEVIIRRTRDDDARGTAPLPRREADRDLPPPKSRDRGRVHYDDSESEHEIVIRRDQEKRRGRDTTREREEIIIRSSSRSRSRSPSPAPSVRSSRSLRSAPPPEPSVVYAPVIHQEVVTHHRHIDHGYEVAIAPRPQPVSRPPSPPSPPPPQPLPKPVPAREQSEERIEIHRSGERNGRAYDEDIVIERNEGARSVPPSPANERYDPPARRENRPRDDRDIEEEAEYYNQRALERSYPGEAYRGATRDWGLVDIPPGTRKVRMDGAGGGAQEVSWQRYNGMRKSKYYPEADDDDEAYSNYEVARSTPASALVPRPEPLPTSGGDIGRRYGKSRDPKAGLWTEITKDLVVKEAITEMGYEYEETEEFYYVIAYLKYDDVARLVALSEDIRKQRRRRVKELEWESRFEPEPPAPRRPLAIEPPPPIRSPRSAWDREDDRYIEREIIYRGGRPPPPPPGGWRR